MGGMTVAKRVLTIGRDTTCDVHFDGNQVSHLHARLVARDQRVYIEDAGSANGTWLNGQRLKGPAPLAPGDEVGLGSFRVQGHALLERVRVALAGPAGPIGRSGTDIHPEVAVHQRIVKAHRVSVVYLVFGILQVVAAYGLWSYAPQFSAGGRALFVALAGFGGLCVMNGIFGVSWAGGFCPRCGQTTRLQRTTLAWKCSQCKSQVAVEVRGILTVVLLTLILLFAGIAHLTSSEKAAAGLAPYQGGSGFTVSHSPRFFVDVRIDDCSDIWDTCARLVCEVRNDGDAAGQAVVRGQIDRKGRSPLRKSESAYLSPGEVKTVKFTFKEVEYKDLENGQIKGECAIVPQ